jgi:hypothetical protein
MQIVPPRPETGGLCKLPWLAAPDPSKLADRVVELLRAGLPTGARW